MSEKVHHATIELEHEYSAAVERVFREFADPRARASWSVSSNDELVYDESNFRPGGRDAFRCGPRGDLKFEGTTIYHYIVQNECVISTETLESGGHRLAVALNTLEFHPTPQGTKLVVTAQIVSFAGPSLIDGYLSGNKAALDGLSRHLARPSKHVSS